MVLPEFLFFYFLFFRRQGFRITIFDRAGPLQNFNWSHVMVIGISVSFSDPTRTTGGDVMGAPKSLPSPPNPRNIFEKFSREKKLRNVSPPTPHPHIFCFVCVLRPQEKVFAEKNSVTKNFHPPPSQPSPHNTHLNHRAMISNPIHLINTQSQQCLCTHRPACLSMFTLYVIHNTMTSSAC